MKELNLKKINLTFDNEAHRYTLNGEWVPGVSSVSSMLPMPWLAPWAAKMAVESLKTMWREDVCYTKAQIEYMLSLAKNAHRVKKETAGTKGNIAHDWFEQYIKTGEKPPMPEDPEILNCVNHFLNWEKENHVEWIASEVVVASEVHRFAGTLDAIAMINGKHALVDFKTSSHIGTDYYLQVAGYQMALEELGYVGIEERWILRFPKKEGDDYEVRKIPTAYEHDKEAFLSALSLYRYVNYAKKITESK